MEPASEAGFEDNADKFGCCADSIEGEDSLFAVVGHADVDALKEYCWAYVAKGDECVEEEH